MWKQVAGFDIKFTSSSTLFFSYVFGEIGVMLSLRSFGYVASTQQHRSHRSRWQQRKMLIVASSGAYLPYTVVNLLFDPATTTFVCLRYHFEIL